MVFFWALLILIGMITADFFVPMLPSATLVTAAAGLVLGNPWLIAVLLVGAAGSSWFGEFMGYKVFRAVRAGLRRRPPRFAARFAERTVMGAVLKLEKLLQGSVEKHPYRTTVIARFLPAGRTTLAWVAAGAGRVPYGRMAALGGVLWAVYTVSLGLLIAWIAGPGLQSLLGSVLTVLAVGFVLGWVAKRWQRSQVGDLEPAAAPAIAAGPESAPEPGAAPCGAPGAECGAERRGAAGAGRDADPGSAQAA
ncbi:VTT domain-containing protein [Glycomyces endophyticus]|uniref:VTT domain-containing protein n=1 Tax=Glycomyces endophyticus TaxID=480996 RepID=A0ABN2HKN0_9ACTN